jgi:hypothetical protein
MNVKVFPIIQGSSSAMWMFFGIILFLVLLAAFFTFLTFSARNIRCEVDSRGIRIRGGF